MIYKVEMKRPNGGNRILKKYYHNELSKLKAFFDNELEFYQYYRSGSIYLDYKYFQRGKFDIKLALDNFSPLKKILNGIKTSKIIRFSRFFAFTDLPNYSSNSISKGANARP
ncbi:RteC domain-containing protein [Flavobacterium sp. SCIV07]|nr:RteC domain-containing protein [Flavobacterium soyae]